jgi:PAS domain S-box-containing protein
MDLAESLEQAHLYWESVVNTMAEGLFIVDTEGVVVFINPAAERITGYTRDEVLGRPCSVFESETCLACSSVNGQFSCGLFEKGRVTNRRCTLSSKDGGLIHLLKNASVLRDRDGQVIGGVETLTDISEVVDKDRQISHLKRELDQSYGFEGMIGNSEVMRQVYQLLAAAADSQAPVVLLGESGTGKELAAQAVHRRSPRAKGPFVGVNCAALNESLLESELFGHEKGAFTGADRTRQGRFEAADHGTLFLDEIGDLPSAVQIKLLRVLQESEIQRVGSNQNIKVDVRIITATHRDLAALISEGKFRQDLYYRINVVPIHLPALRERVEDIPLLARGFIERNALRSGRPITGISQPALGKLMAYGWPGNVRELINAIEYAFVTCPSGLIQPRHLPPTVLAASPQSSAAAPLRPAAPSPAGQDDMRARIEEALLAAGGNKSRAAEHLGVSRVTLWKRMKKLGMD